MIIVAKRKSDNVTVYLDVDFSIYIVLLVGDNIIPDLVTREVNIH